MQFLLAFYFKNNANIHFRDLKFEQIVKFHDQIFSDDGPPNTLALIQLGTLKKIFATVYFLKMAYFENIS